MCVYSMVTDHYSDKWGKKLPTHPYPSPNWPDNIQPPFIPTIPQEEVEEFKKLLERAREYDKKNNEPHCDLQEKKDTLKKIAKVLGVDISFIDEE